MGVANYISVHVCVHSPQYILTDIFMFMCVISGEISYYKNLPVMS